MQDRPEGVPRRPLRAHADRQGRQVESQGARIEGRPVRVGGDRALPEARIQRRGALMEMCLAGVSTRGVDDISRLLWGERMPSRTLSDKLKKIHKEIDEKTANPPWPRQGRSRAKWRNASSRRPRTACAGGVGETAACLLPGFPANHGIKPRTDDMIERLNKEIRRRTRVVGGFPDSNSALMLVCAGIRYVASRSWSDRRYMDMSRLDDNPGAAA